MNSAGLIFCCKTVGCSTRAHQSSQRARGCVCVCRVLTALGDWLSAGGLYIIAGCLASVATLIVVLSVAVCLVRTRLSGRRRRKMLPVTTKIELQETPPSDEPALVPAHDPLLARQMSDVALNEFESQPVRYVVGLQHPHHHHHHHHQLLCSI